MAYGQIVDENQIIVEWSSRLSNSNAKGLFLLNVDPRGTTMYGYSSALSEHNAIVYTTWVLAKKTGVDESEIKERSCGESGP